MIDSVNGDIIGAQNNHLKGQGWRKATNVHCHCLLGRDGRAGTMAESPALCRQPAEEAITAAAPISLVTDSYGINIRRPWIRAAFGHMSIRLSEDFTHLVYIENPTIVANGQDIMPVLLYGQQEADR